MLDDYLIYKDGRARGPSVITIAGLGAINAYFNKENYFLSAELLTHFYGNKTLNSTYMPMMKTEVAQSSIIGTIKGYSYNSGSGEFKKGYGSGDLYYAIHLFNWTKDPRSKEVTITDRYDFDRNDRYSGLAGTAVNFLAIAQENGELLPFYTRINV